MDTESALRPSPSESEGHISFLGTFASPAVESAFRQRHLADERWLNCFLVLAVMLRVALLLVADYQDFGVGPSFWPLFAGRLLFVLVSGWVFAAMRRAASPAAADRLLFSLCSLTAALTVYLLSARPPGNTDLLLMSFGPVLVVYCVTPLPLSRQALLALGYSAAVLYVARGVDGATLSTVAAVYGLCNLFGGVASWRLNHRRREAFLAGLREAELRARLQEALAEIRTLRGLLCICAWCKRVRDDGEAWQDVETFVENRTHAEFTHGICPDCYQSQMKQFEGSLS